MVSHFDFGFLLFRMGFGLFDQGLCIIVGGIYLFIIVVPSREQSMDTSPIYLYNKPSTNLYKKWEVNHHCVAS